MKISYNVLKKYLPKLPEVEKMEQTLIMHTAEVEELIYEKENLRGVFVGKVVSCEKHPESEKLNLCEVKVNGKTYNIVCGANNVKAGIKVAVATIGTQLTPDFEIQKTKIAGYTSKGMICSEDELGLTDIRQEGILILPEDATLDMPIREYLGFTDVILEVDNKAINHRPDMFSHIGVARELAVLFNLDFPLEYIDEDFSNANKLDLVNQIPEVVKRYIGLELSGVANTETPQEIKDVISTHEIDSKGMLVDVTNYSLYFYGQPTHIFDKDKINGTIHVRYAKDGEQFTGLNDKDYELTGEDIVIADESKVLALGGVIGGLESAVSDSTENIVIEGAHFDQAIVRKTGKRHGIRTDSLNVFEKDIPSDLAIRGVSLIYNELKELFPELKVVSYNDSYKNKQEEKSIELDVKYINRLIGYDYEENEVKDILSKLGLTLETKNSKLETLKAPFWRTDLETKADIAEEVARIKGYDNVGESEAKLNLGAVIQNNIYKIKKESVNFLTSTGFFEIYHNSFVGKKLLEKSNMLLDTETPLKNFLSEDVTHLRSSLIPSLLETAESNIKQTKEMKIFEIDKVFKRNEKGEMRNEDYNLSGLIVKKSDNLYYDIQNEVINLLNTLGVDNFFFTKTKAKPNYAHSGRCADIVVRGKSIGTIGEISPNVTNNFEIDNRIAYFEINLESIENACFKVIKNKKVSNFQENNFDLCFVVDKTKEGKEIKNTIASSDKSLITKVELFDIYESEEKLPGKRSISYKVYIQSETETLDDKIKGELIDKIVEKVTKKGGELR